MKYTVEIIHSNRKTMSLEIRPDGRLVVRAPFTVRRQEIERFVNAKSAWIERHLDKRDAVVAQPLPPALTAEEIQHLTEQAKVYIPQRAAFYAPLIGVTYCRITIRCQKTRWGSCSSKGNLNFNCLLMLMPQEVIDSVVVHELCHRKEMNHSERFYSEVLKVFPDYRRWQRWLKENGRSVMLRIRQ